MCGRYVVAYDPETLVAGFSLVRVVPFPKRWNVAPQSSVPVIFETRDGERVAEPMRWGLLPHWAKDTALALKLNNARAESVFDKPSFRQAVRRRRCILPASGFYEWQAVPGASSKTPKQPWYISPASASTDGNTDHATDHATPAAPLAMAGLFEAWRAGEDEPWLLSCCVVTTEPNALMAPIHDRMPVLLSPADIAVWLDRGVQDPAVIAPLLRPAPEGVLQAWPVSRAVSRGAAEGAALVLPMTVPMALPGISPPASA